MRAAKRGTGVRLSSEDAFELSRDDTISTRAWMDDANDNGETDDDIHPRRTEAEAKLEDDCG
jgi:hypothetical protein